MPGYDAWKTRSPDDEAFRGLRYCDDEPEEECALCGGLGALPAVDDDGEDTGEDVPCPFCCETEDTEARRFVEGSDELA